MMDFSAIKKLTIGGVELKQLFIGGIQVWKSGYKNHPRGHVWNVFVRPASS